MVYEEERWGGLSWWSMHRPQWTLEILWNLADVAAESIEPLPGHPALLDAGRLLGKQLDPALF